MFKRCHLMMGIGLSLLAPAANAQENARDVPASHWAYNAVQDLAGKGLIQGYPPDGRFLGGRTLTRYEMATIIERVLTRVDNLLSQKADKADLDKLQSSIGEIRQLVDEFKPQLLVIGTDLKKAQDELETLRAQVSEVSAKADQAATLADQALENINELKTQTNATLAKKVDVGTGKLRVSGLIQAWAVTPWGKTPGGQAVGSASTPPGRSFGGGAGDTFRLRRGELAFVGSITPRVDYRAMFDIAKIVSVSGGTVSAAGVNTPASTSPSSNVLQDLWVGYQIAPRFRVEVGQQKTGLSEEGTHSSSDILTVERSIMNGLPATVGRVGDIRDTGVMLKFANLEGNITLGLFNGNGESQNDVDRNRQKFAMFNAYYNGVRHLSIGAWGGANIGDSQPSAGLERLGATLLYKSGPHFFEAEGALTRDYAAGNGIPGQGTSGRGAYGLYAHSLSRKWQLVGRYDVWDPAYQAGKIQASATTVGNGSFAFKRDAHNVFEYTLGANYYISGNNAKIQLNYIWEDVQANAQPFFGQRRQLLIANFQTAF